MLTKRPRYHTIAVLALVLPLLALSGGAEARKRPPPTPWTGPVPRADCGPNDRVETGLQGQTTLAERASGDSELGYNCNLELVGQFQGEGAKYQMAWFKDCAYYGTNNNPRQQHRGTVVVDASDPRNPRRTAILDTPAMLDPHESLKVNKKRQLLAGVQLQGPGFAIYDLADCAHPVLKASVVLEGVQGHAGDFAPDGRTYYGSSGAFATQLPKRPHIYAIDVTDPSNPRQIGRFFNATHDLSISEDGTRAYLAPEGNFVDPQFPNVAGPNGLVILDVSDIQFRRPNPQVRVISTLFWDDGAVAQQTIPVTYRGRPHVIFVDEIGSGPFPTAAGRAEACRRGLPPFGFARIIDISDETKPKTIAKLLLEVDDPANCPLVLNDFEPDVTDLEFYGYSTHYCGVDKARSPRMLACSSFTAGLRVFDIRDPYRPREIAYYKPPARRTAFLPGSSVWEEYGGRDRTTDRASTQVRFRKHKGETHLWFTSQDNGFQIVRFTKSMRELLGKGKDDDEDDD